MAEDVQLLNEITSEFQINQRASMATTGLSGRQLSNSRRTRWRVRDSGKDNVLAATDHLGINSSSTACAAAALQSSSSFSRTSGTSMSKASRYLQKHAAQRPSALQQMQAFSQRHNKDTDGNHNQASLADSCSSLIGLSSNAMQQLQLARVSEALSNASEGTAAIEDDTGMTGLYQVGLQPHAALHCMANIKEWRLICLRLLLLVLPCPSFSPFPFYPCLLFQLQQPRWDWPLALICFCCVCNVGSHR